MSDIFLSYDSRDLERIKPLATALHAQGWTVFYDRTIPPGKTWRQVIGKQIDECRCMVVAWSIHSISDDSHWVCEEAEDGRKRKILIPIMLDNVTPPWGFRSIQAADLIGWSGDKKAFGYLALCDELAGHLGQTLPMPTQPIKETPIPQRPLIIEPDMVRLPAGSFKMGSDSYDSEKPIRTVDIKSFAIGRYPVTFDEYDHYAEMAGKPKPDDEGWGRGKRPVINVSWEDAIDYASWLKEKTGKPYRLPTEAEWEFAARAGTTGDYYWGKGDINEFAWFKDNSGGKTQPVGAKKPNAFDLYDMSGNVWEWVQDHWHHNYDNAPGDGKAWITDESSGYRVLRGGSWYYGAQFLRSAYRNRGTPGYRYDTIGFRLAQD